MPPRSPRSPAKMPCTATTQGNQRQRCGSTTRRPTSCGSSSRTRGCRRIIMRAKIADTEDVTGSKSSIAHRSI